jgi:hypothetical protein
MLIYRLPSNFSTYRLIRHEARVVFVVCTVYLYFFPAFPIPFPSHHPHILSSIINIRVMVIKMGERNFFKCHQSLRPKLIKSSSVSVEIKGDKDK